MKENKGRQKLERGKDREECTDEDTWLGVEGVGVEDVDDGEREDEDKTDVEADGSFGGTCGDERDHFCWGKIHHVRLLFGEEGVVVGGTGT